MTLWQEHSTNREDFEMHARGTRLILAASLFWVAASASQATVIYDAGTPQRPTSITGLSLVNGLFDAVITYNTPIDGTTISNFAITGSPFLAVGNAMFTQLNATGIDSRFTLLNIVLGDLGSSFVAILVRDFSVGGNNWTIPFAVNSVDTTGDALTGFVTFVPSTVPEPASLLLLSFGLIALSNARRVGRRSTAD